MRRWIYAFGVISGVLTMSMLSTGCSRSGMTITCPPETESAGSQPPWGRHAYCLKGDGEAAVKHGPEMRWFPGGKAQLSQNWSDGELHGLSTSWYSNGQRSKRGITSTDLKMKCGSIGDAMECFNPRRPTRRALSMASDVSTIRMGL